MTPALHPREPTWDTVSAPHRLALGLRALRPGESWIDLDEDLAVDLLEKNRLFRTHHAEVFVEEPTSRAAQCEVLAMVVRELLARYAGEYTKRGDRVHIEVTGEEVDLEDASLAPLERAARCIQEDLVIMQARPEGWCLVAGAVCFPTRWALRPLLGRPMTALHEPVPGYREHLHAAAQRFFDGMKPGHVFARGNWSLMDDPTLFQPSPGPHPPVCPELDANNAGECLWLRVEHQTLQRLPVSDAILFGIRIHRTQLREVAKDAGAASRLAAAIESMAPEMRRYKSLDPICRPALAYLTANQG